MSRNTFGMTVSIMLILLALNTCNQIEMGKTLDQIEENTR